MDKDKQSVGGLLPPKYIVKIIILPILLSNIKKMCGRMLSSPTMIIGKDKQNGGGLPPPYTDLLQNLL